MILHSAYDVILGTQQPEASSLHWWGFPWALALYPYCWKKLGPVKTLLCNCATVSVGLVYHLSIILSVSFLCHSHDVTWLHNVTMSCDVTWCHRCHNVMWCHMMSQCHVMSNDACHMTTMWCHMTHDVMWYHMIKWLFLLFYAASNKTWWKGLKWDYLPAQV